jgi:hypothetical protein
MISSRRLAFFLLLGLMLFPLSAFAQFDVSPTNVYQPPGDPSCLTFTVYGAPYAVVDFEVYYPSGGPVYWNGLQLDFNGQTYGCIDAGWEVGPYTITAVNFNGNWYPVSGGFTINPAPPPPPVIYAVGSGCDNWDCVMATGLRFHTDSYVQVYSTDWLHSEIHYGDAWGMSPPLWIGNGETDWLAFQLTDPDIRASFGWNGVYFRVVNYDGSSTPWTWVGVAPPTVTSATPTCADLYCIQFDGFFPLNAFVPLTVPGGSGEWLPDPYTDYVVTATQITFRLNPSVRYTYDTVGLNAWVANFAIMNWNGPYFLPPVDRAVIGHVEAIVGNAPNYSLAGWACAKTLAGSIQVHVYVGGPYLGGGTFAFWGNGGCRQ